MPSVNNVLIIGAGAAGAASAILLAQAGVSVDLVEIKADVSLAGSGITLQGTALRVLKQLGVWQRVEAVGYSYDSLGLRAPDADATLLAEIPDVRSGGPDLPATCGARRSDLAQILLDRAREVGAKVHFNTSVQSMQGDDTGVQVLLSTGVAQRYDLVIGADGVRSATRAMLGIELETIPAGMGIWRCYGPRPESITRTDLVYGGPSYIAGYCPTSQESLYAYIVEHYQDRSSLTPAQRLATMVELTEPYHGPWDEIRDGLTNPDQVNYARFESHLLPRPWNRGRVVLVGDAVHACPPTLALGAAMALEDAAVLAGLLIDADSVDQAVFDAYVDRRYERCKLVVASSIQLVQWLLDHNPNPDVPGLMRQVYAVVGQPA